MGINQIPLILNALKSQILSILNLSILNPLIQGIPVTLVTMGQTVLTMTLLLFLLMTHFMYISQFLSLKPF